jgi:hypothetical protein
MRVVELFALPASGVGVGEYGIIVVSCLGAIVHNEKRVVIGRVVNLGAAHDVSFRPSAERWSNETVRADQRFDDEYASSKKTVRP